MKRFTYSLNTVLDYKTQVLDNLKTEHAFLMEHVNNKQKEIRQLNCELNGYKTGFNQVKTTGASIESFRLYDMCIGRMEEIIEDEQELLRTLKKKEEGKKKEVITAKVDTSKFEKLKERKIIEYRKEEMKAEEAFVEEFVVQRMVSDR